MFYKIFNKEKFIKLGYFFSFIPFFSLFPLGSDLQPFCLFFILPVLIIDSKKLKLNFSLILLLFLFFYSIAFQLYGFNIKNSFLLLFAMIVSIFYWNYSSKNLDGVISTIIVLNFIILLLQTIFPGFVTPLLEMFVRTIKVVELSGARGASGLSAEPGFQAVLQVSYFLVLYDLFRKGLITNKRFFFFSLIILFSIILTKSGSGSLFLLISITFIIFSQISFKNLLYFVLLLFPISILFIYYYEEGFFTGRFFNILYVILSNPSDLLFLDSSIGHRMNNIVVGLYAPFINLFGFGAGEENFINASRIILSSIDIHFLGSASNISAFANFSVSYGVVFILFLFILYFLRFFSIGFACLPWIAISFLMVLSSFSFAFPIIWYSLFSRRF